MSSVISQVWRSWKTGKTVSIVAALALAVGIGSTTATYTVVNAVMLKPLPYPHDEQWVALYGARFNEPGQLRSWIKDAEQYDDLTFIVMKVKS